MTAHELMVPVLVRRLRDLDDDGRLTLAREVIEQLGNRFAADVCAVLADELDGVNPAWVKLLPDTPNAAWLRTRLLSDPADVAAAWQRFVPLQPKRDPLDLLAWARALASTGAVEEAAWKLRQAMALEVPQSFFARAEKLIAELSGSVRSNIRQCRLAIIGSSTTNLLVPVVRALCLRDRITAEIYEAPFGSTEQEILGDASGLALFRPTVVMLVTHWRDFPLSAVTEDEPGWVTRFVEERKALWQRLLDRFPCHIVQPSFDYPAEEAYGYLAGTLPGGRTRVIDLLNLRLREAASANISILDLAAVQRETGARRWNDEQAWARYRLHPSAEALPALAEAYMSHVRAVLGLSRKVLVTDLDNTLWSGVIGEDGLDGIGIGPDTPEGEAHLALQRYLLDLKRRGILLAVCSKNNLEDARLPFERHPRMALRLEDFAAFRASWEDKASGLRAIARDLSLGLDSFVFLDDNPLERDWVRSELPEVAVVEAGSSPFQFVRQLDRGHYFTALSLSNEDLVRAEQYRVEAQRESVRAASASVEEFLRNLQLEASVESVAGRNLARVTQLVNKTNQFNLTTRRYSEAEVRAFAEDARGWASAFRMSDRMGDYGLIGVIFCRPVGDAVWEIDTWLMSCRALGRQMEKFMFDRLVEAARARGIAAIAGVYRPTPKNGLVRDLFDQLAFRRTSATGEEVRYTLEVASVGEPAATHVRNASAPAGAVQQQ